MVEYVYSFDDETCYGTFDTEKEAINAALEDYELYQHENEYEFIFVGKMERFEPQVNVEIILEDIADDAYDRGFDGRNYLNNIKGNHIEELKKILTKAYNEWENAHPEYRIGVFMVNPKRYSIEELMEEEN